MQAKRILITGIAGFIGFHLASFLIKNNYKVIGCDDFNAYYCPKLKKQRAEQLKRLGTPILPLDVQNIQTHQIFFESQKITHIVHLAAQAGVRHSLAHPMPYIESNIKGFLSVLELARALQLKCIFASSSSVYGGNAKVPFSEGDPTDTPMSLYAATKKSGELLAKSYHSLYQIPMIGLRFFTVYGPWGRPDMAYFSFSENILQGLPIPLFNRGNMKRDFTYIDDVVQGIARAIDACKGGFEIYNLGNDKPESIMDLVTHLETALGKKAHIELLPMQKGDTAMTWADITKAQKDLQFAPQTSLASGIQKFSEWFLNWKSTQSSNL